MSNIASADNLLTTFYNYKYNILDKAVTDLSAINLQPAIGIELEFYLFDQKKLAIANDEIVEFINLLRIKLDHDNFSSVIIEQEQGCSQVEIKTVPYRNIQNLCRDLNSIKLLITKTAAEQNYIASFAAQPIENDCGSALQINLSLIDHHEHNLFAGNYKNESQLLRWSVCGILHLINYLTIFAAPTAEDYQRYDYEHNHNLFQCGKYTAPINASWGYNNRTAAIRIPSNYDKFRRLEYRLPASDADIVMNIATLLIAVKWGIDFNIEDKVALYGNAFDLQYNLPSLCRNYDEAYHHFLSPDNPLLKLISLML